MGLFTKNKKELELPELEPMTAAPRRVTSYEVQHRAHNVQREITNLLDEYRLLMNQGEQLSVQKYQELIRDLTKTAQEFEKVYELLKFDMEKEVNIQKYHEETLRKRKELINTLNEGEKGSESKKTPEEPDKPSKK